MTDGALIGLTVATYGLSLGCIVSGGWGIFKLYVIRTVPFVQKRSGYLLFGFNISLIIEIVAVTIAFAVGLPIIPFVEYQDPDGTYNVLANAISLVCWYLFSFFLVTKCWLIYFDEMWTFHCLQNEWQKLLKASVESANWYVRNRLKYGSYCVIKMLGAYHVAAFIISLCSGIFYFNLGLIPEALALVMSLLPFLPPVAFYVTINMLTSRFSLIDDVWFIHWERRWIGKLLILFLAIYVAQQCSYSLLGDEHIAALLFTPLYIIATYAILHVSTHGIYSKNRTHLLGEFSLDASIKSPTVNWNGENGETFTDTLRKMRRVPQNKYLVQSLFKMLQRGHSFSNWTRSEFRRLPKLPRDVLDVISAFIRYDLYDPHCVSLEMVLGTEESLHLFMGHLSREHSMEYLLCYIELSQFQRHVLMSPDPESPAHCTRALNHIEAPFHLVELPAKLPVSSIVADESTSHKAKAARIYQKYVEREGSLECYINAELREQLAPVLADEEKLCDDDAVRIKDIFLLIEKIKREMMCFILEPAFWRFEQCADWRKVALLFDHQLEIEVEGSPRSAGSV